MRQASGAMSQEVAEALAVDALTFLAAEPERLGRFLALSGLSPENLRSVAASPGFLAAILNHLAQDEALLLDFAKSVSCDPKDVLLAKNCLEPPEESWP